MAELAQRRLQELPLPAGEHPFLDEIVVTAEATARALAALAAVPGGDDAYAAAREGGAEIRRTPHRR